MTEIARTRLLLLLILAVITVIINVASIIVTSTLKTPSNDQTTKCSEKNAYVCFDCKKLIKRDTFELNPKWIQKEDGQCCSTQNEAIKAILNLTVLKSRGSAKMPDLKSMDPTNFRFSKASAHKAYIRTDVARDLSDKYLLLDTFPIFLEKQNCSLGMDPYRHNHLLLEHNKDVIVTKEGFEITVPGWYYVYTSVLFKPDTGRPCNAYKYQTWGHWIKLNRPGQFQDEMVLSTYHTCGDNDTRKKDTSHTGRVMHLEVGDKLRAEVSGYGLISYQAYSNFMGLYLLHGGQ